MTTLATSEVHAAVERAAAHLLNAAGPDGVVSRKDIRDKLNALEGPERELVDTLYRFIHGRAGKPSARMTKRDIDTALAHVRTEIIERVDLDKNGLSEDEVSRMSELGKLAVTLARTLKDVSGPTGAQLAQELGKLSKGLFFDCCYGTEGGVGIASFHAAAKLPHLTQDTFRTTLGLTAAPEHDVTKFESGDRALQAILKTHWDSPEQEQAEKLVQFMKTHLREVHAALVGQDAGYGRTWEIQVYIVGLDAKGNLVGLKTGVVWT
jgi:hypothetical protein